MILPGSTIGILGGGQLGRMTALAAANLGYRAHIYCPDAGAPATQITPLSTIAAYDDRDALDRFAGSVDVITLEFENIPAEVLEYLIARVRVRPRPSVLRITQHRLHEKKFAQSLGIGTAPFQAVATLADARAAMETLGLPLVLKTCRFGYDGKGQAIVRTPEELEAAFYGLKSDDVIAEAFVRFTKEISVIAARGLDGVIACYPVAENIHENHILAATRTPADLTPAVAQRAQDIARALTEGLNVTGLLAVEMFVTESGEVLVNEMAPRPHNSGHFTMDACVTSQFEQLIRAVCGLPLGDTSLLCPAEMTNLLGDVSEAYLHLFDPRCKLHLYGKTAPAPGRKMGHVTRLG